jgi:phage repressor protein C with HTH and peptisase S24 domain
MLLISKEELKIKNFPDRLREAIGDKTVRTFSKLSGISHTALNSYINNQTYPSLDKLALIADASGRSIEWLASGEIPDSRMVPVYQYDLLVSAGNGSLIEHETPIARFEFSEEWLRSQSLFGKTLSIVQVTGDSMEPTLYDGDLILVRHYEVNDGVCVIRINDRILVKRVQHDFIDNSYKIISDNPHYKAHEIPSDFRGDFAVIGQVVRVLQRVRQYDTVQ